MSDFWLNNLSVLFNKNNIFEIIPNSTFDNNQKLNAIFRFSIYYSIVSFAIFKNNNVFIFPFVVMIVTIILNNNTRSNKSKSVLLVDSDEIQKNKSCKLPNLNNPFMNLNMFDINKKNKPACLYYDKPEIQNEINNFFDTGLYKGVADIYSNNNSQNRYYTMPNTMPSNNKIEFGNWCYKRPKTCKEGNGVQCSANLYNRINRHSIG